MAILPDGYKFCLGQRVMLLRLIIQNVHLNIFFMLLFLMMYIDRQLEKNNASTVAHVNVKDVNTL